MVCIDNDGGQIFSMLPIHGRIDADYETIFRTPRRRPCATQGLAGINVTVVDADDFRPCFRPPAPRPSQVSIS